MNGRVYYNEFDKRTAAWLRQLIADGILAAGDVDERSIEDVVPSDLRGYHQCHFFAGIGGWAYALALAGWPADRPVWTGSCPCQPFSAAGAGAGFADERHLWPAFFHLISECRPANVFGEQVASAAAGPWLDLVLADLESLGYAGGSIAFPAAGLGAPHIRDRTYWAGVRLAHAHDSRLEGRRKPERQRAAECAAWSRGVAGGMADSLLQQRSVARTAARDIAETLGRHEDSSTAAVLCCAGGTAPLHGFWADADWLLCRDGKWRPVEPGTFPLAHGIPERVVRLRGYGNAIVPQQAAEFVLAFDEACGGLTT
ncbi:DNA cytosine methyltransferase [Dokdonella sp. MW10]|uniref:DNA cytosine methyltransferase n=1 Tax=Dokdonella sp. MW10 TaxID=2992926 RepID=UPI003F7E373A